MATNAVRKRKSAVKSGDAAPSPQQAKESEGFPYLFWTPPLLFALLAVAYFWNSHRSPVQITRKDRDRFNLTTLIHEGPITVDHDRREAVRRAFQHSWKAYERDAFGFDNYHPLQQSGSNIETHPIGYFIVDCLDSLWLMGSKQDYKKARDWVANKLTFDGADDRQHAFEVTIRVLGGLLAAIHVAGPDQQLLNKAIDLGDRLLPIFDTKSGIPMTFVNLHQRKGILDRDNNGLASVAEAGTLQLEMRYLSELSGKKIYWEKALRASEIIAGQPKQNGLVPIFLRTDTGGFVLSDIRLGSRADSYYEYLYKLFVQTRGKEQKWEDRYQEALKGIKRHMVSRGVFYNSLYTKELSAKPQIHGKIPYMQLAKQDHLVCFLPGLIFLGASQGGQRLERSQLTANQLTDLHVAGELLDTCLDTYFQSKTGLGAEIVFFYTKEDKPKDSPTDWYVDKRSPQGPTGKPPPPYDARNMLRPETLESLFVAYRMTGNPSYRQQAWDIFQAFEKHCRIPTGGYASIKDVDDIDVVHDDKMETFWLSESLKYLFLIFSDDKTVPLTSNVLTTEAHIFPTFDPKVTRLRPG